MLVDLDRLVESLERERRILEIHDTHDLEETERLNALDRDLHTLKAARRVVYARRSAPQRIHPRLDIFNPQSNIGVIIQILRDADRALPISEIIKLAADVYNHPVKRSSVSSRIAKLAKDKRVFRRYGLGVYGLISWPDKRKSVGGETDPSGSATPLAACGTGEGNLT